MVHRRQSISVSGDRDFLLMRPFACHLKISGICHLDSVGQEWQVNTMKLNDLLEPQTWMVLYATSVAWFEQEVLALESLIQLGILLIAAIIAYAIQKPLKPRLSDKISQLRVFSPLRRFLAAVSNQFFSVIFLIILWLATGVSGQVGSGLETDLLEIIASLMSAWIIIRLTSALIANPFVAQLVAALAWTIAALNIVGLLSPTIDALDSVSFPLGQTRITFLTVVNGILLMIALLWSAMVISKLADNRLSQVSEITPRARVLIGKTIRFVAIVVAVIVALSSVGINFAALAVFSGAVGVGIGIGLQKQVSNLLSGVILLLDKSIKPGDVIEVGQTFGWVNKMNARYVGVTTRDNKELLIPNDDFVTHQVINWSHSAREVRMEVKFGVTYKCKPREVRELAAACAVKIDRVVKDPAPVCHLLEFGDSSVNFTLRFWIRDPEGGVTNVKGQVLLELWDALEENGIEIPYPQRVIHMAAPEKEAPVLKD
ncbi:MAG: mechanosensitive ion channel [Rhodospirillaceae bacterium]